MFDIIALIVITMILGIIMKNIMTFRTDMEKRLYALEISMSAIEQIMVIQLKRSGASTLAPGRAETDAPELAPGRESQTFTPKSSVPPSPLFRPSITEILHDQEEPGYGSMMREKLNKRS